MATLKKTSLNNIKGVCMICGCTDNNACTHPIFGACWWINDKQNLCSHCVELKDDPDVIIAHGNSESRGIRTKEMFQ